MEEKTKDKGLYLPEDLDLLDELETFGPVVSEAGHAGQNRKLLTLQIKAALRNRKSLDKADKTTRFFSFILVILTLVLIVIAVIQFTFDIQASSETWWQKLIPLLLLLGFAAILSWTTPKYLEEIMK